MELPINAAVEQMMMQKGVQGVEITDKIGLCVTRRGDIPSISSGVLRSLSIHAASLSRDPTSEPPMVILETEKTCVDFTFFFGVVFQQTRFTKQNKKNYRKLIIKTQQDVTTAIHRSRRQAPQPPVPL